MKKIIMSCFIVILSSFAFAEEIGPCTADTRPGARCYTIVQMQADNSNMLPTRPLLEPNEPNHTTNKEKRWNHSIVRPYLSGNVGIGNLKYDVDSIDETMSDSGIGQFGGAIGVGFAKVPLRFEFAYTKKSDANGSIPIGANSISAELKSTSTMFNLFLDILTEEDSLGLILGAGYGKTNLKSKMFLSGPGVNGSPVLIGEENKSYNTLAFYIGTMVPLTQKRDWFLDITGTYYNIDIDNNDRFYGLAASAGIRYMFDF